MIHIEMTPYIVHRTPYIETVHFLTPLPTLAVQTAPDELHFHVGGIIKDVARLKLLFELFAETLDQLCMIGSAYAEAPKRKR